MQISRLDIALRACYTVHILCTGGTQTMTRTILLLEDDPIVRHLLDAVLTDEGHDVRPCGSRDQLLAAARDMPVSLAVVDFWGRSHERLADDERAELVQLARTVPTVLVTARAWASVEAAGNLGLVAMVPKPFDVDDLCAVVADALDGMTPAAVA